MAGRLPRCRGSIGVARSSMVGTLSKILFPGVRLGFAVVPRPLIEVFRGARFLADRHPPLLPQALVTSFMQRGFLTSHIQRMRQQYRIARDIVVDGIARSMGEYVEVEAPDYGIQLAIYFKRPICDVAVAEAALRQGVVVKAVSPHYLAAPPRSGLILGYSGFDSHQLRTGGRRPGRARCDRSWTSTRKYPQDTRSAR